MVKTIPTMMSPDDYEEWSYHQRRSTYLVLRNSYGYKKDKDRRKEIEQAYSDVSDSKTEPDSELAKETLQ